MKDWIATLLRSEDAKEIHTEYSILLSTGMSDNEAEDLVISFFLSDSIDIQHELFWVLFALIQWKVGRLSKKVYDTAMQYICTPYRALPDEVPVAVTSILNSPMPKHKDVVKLRTLKCPWPKGALLAYRIATNSERSGSRFWNQYVLLRIVEIKKWPISAINPDLLYNESMYVALYNWIGASIPNASVVTGLEYTPISFRKPMILQLSDKVHLDCIERIVNGEKKNTAFDKEYTHFVYALDWGSKKNTAAVFTKIDEETDTNAFIGLDEPEMKIPPMTGLSGFDTVLVKRLNQLFPEVKSGDGMSESQQ